jgi:hypothetical protein
MKKHEVKSDDHRLYYYTSGEKPSILFASGIHGDEVEAIECAMKSIKKYENKLLDFIFIPEVCPSAVAAGTRTNKDGVDLNRCFKDSFQCKEVDTVKELVSMYSFDLMVSFHEDPEHEFFYMYDTGNEQKPLKLSDFQNEVKNFGVSLLNGIDDPNDPVLGHVFKDGYCHINPKKNKDNGTFEMWCFHTGLVKRIITPELPGQIEFKKKCKVLELFFKYIIV